MADVYTGRLACDGDGNLYADQSEKVGERTVEARDESGDLVFDPAGDPITFTLPVFKYGKQHGKPVAHGLDTNTYVFVEKGEPSHNEQHHQNHVVVEATIDALYNKDGELVTDPPPPHHFSPTEDDPHYEASARNKTLIRDDPDDIAPTTSSHTEAYV